MYLFLWWCLFINQKGITPTNHNFFAPFGERSRFMCTTFTWQKNIEKNIWFLFTLFTYVITIFYTRKVDLRWRVFFQVKCIKKLHKFRVSVSNVFFLLGLRKTTALTNSLKIKLHSTNSKLFPFALIYSLLQLQFLCSINFEKKLCTCSIFFAPISKVNEDFWRLSNPRRLTECPPLAFSTKSELAAAMSSEVLPYIDESAIMAQWAKIWEKIK